MALHLCVCLFICSAVCQHAHKPVFLSVSVIAKSAVFIHRPLFDAFPEETLRWLIWGSAHVKLIASLHRHFWQWYWWMGLWKMWRGTASRCNLMLVLWNPNESHLSKPADRFYQADQCKHAKHCVCIMCPWFYLCGQTFYTATASQCARDWVLVCVYVTVWNTLNVKLQRYYHIAHCTPHLLVCMQYCWCSSCFNQVFHHVYDLIYY